MQVQFVADDPFNGHAGAAQAKSDAQGQAQLAVFLPSCPQATFAVTAMPPPGYRATTPTRLTAADGAVLAFGFASDNAIDVPRSWTTRTTQSGLVRDHQVHDGAS